MGATYRADTVIVGGGLAGLVTALELLDAGQSVVLVDAAPRDAVGGLARWAFGGIFIVGSPEQARGRIQDSPELALEDWLRYGELGPADEWPRRWAEAYVEKSRAGVYDWLGERGVGFFPVVHWVERGGEVPGNSVPRFHLVWGTGSRLVEALLQRIAEHPNKDRLLMLHRHRVEGFAQTAGQISGVAGTAQQSDRLDAPTTSFRAEGGAVVLAAGGACGDLARVRDHWPAGYGEPPGPLLNGSHPVADGALHDVARLHGARVTHPDRVWFYAAGVQHWRPEFEDHGLSLVPPRSALWLDSRGRRFLPPLYGGADTSALVQAVCRSEGQYSWIVLNERIARRELAVSGCEFNPAIRDRRVLKFLVQVLLGNTALVRDLVDNCPDFVTGDDIGELTTKMRGLAGDGALDSAAVADEITAFDATAADKETTDPQRQAIAAARRYRGDRVRTCRAARIDDPRGRPLIAIRARVTTRKSLGGLQTDLASRVLDDAGNPIAGLFAVGEAAGFGGGGIHGVRSLEGTFLGGCVLTARHAAEAIARG